MEKLIDMHTHTTYSDGEKTPDELIAYAKSRGIGTISITDHNNVNAYKHITIKDDINIIPGIELTAKDGIGKMHILGYGIDPYNRELSKITKELKESDIDFLLILIDKLKEKGVRILSKDISLLINQEGAVGRGTLARLLVDYGYADTINDVFKLYIDDIYSKISYMRKTLTYEECLEAISNAGGISILAHPYTLNRDYREVERLVVEMIPKGLKGIEVYHSKHSKRYRKKLIDLVSRYDLLYSVGSDYHGEIIKPDIEIGSGKQKNLCLTRCTALDYLKNR